ncbi:hypothetical protein [Portibacter lacus]|uniref:Uncharacterized protein n=1 Tax=Portibacter lacus TaxID=1099794 RepID=A0AA37WCW7_9BACT|nr:hypothetical protein [Portibacter lacus]GLR17156.1 hypothetical protein GCM10007940_17710 [Portibacter lacus]
MKKVAKYTLIVFGLLFFIACMFIFRPVPILFEKDAIIKEGIVSKIYEGQGNDVVFVLENNQQRYYINRGLENGLNLNNLKEKLIGKPIVVKYPKHWTPLDWNSTVKHISKVEFADEVIYNEFRT